MNEEQYSSDDDESYGDPLEGCVAKMLIEPVLDFPCEWDGAENSDRP